MGRFRKLPDRGDMAGFDGLVNNVREAVKHTRELIKKKKKKSTSSLTCKAASASSSAGLAASSFSSATALSAWENINDKYYLQLRECNTSFR